MAELASVGVKSGAPSRARAGATEGLGRTLGWLGLSTSLAVLLASCLGAVSPVLDVPAQLTGQLLGMALASAVPLLVGYRPLVVLAFCGFLAVAAHPLLALRAETAAPGALAQAAAGGPSLKVVSLNTWHQNAEPQRLVSFLTAEQADVALLVEFGPDKLELLHELARFYPYHAGCGADWSCSVMILSRRPFSEAGSAGRDDSEGPPRAWVTFGSGQSALSVMAVHVKRPIDGARSHRREMDLLAGYVRALPGTVVVGGDFNATPWSSSLRGFASISGLEHMGRYMPSWPAAGVPLPQLAIDHLFASQGVDFPSVALGPDVGSDHRPVVATLALPGSVVMP